MEDNLKTMKVIEYAEKLRNAEDEKRRLKNELYMAEQTLKNANMTPIEKYAFDEGERAAFKNLDLETLPKPRITLSRKNATSKGGKKGGKKSKKSRKQRKRL